jgi:hypothetical protein
MVSVNNATGYGSSANEPAALLKGIGVTWTRVDSSAISQTVSMGLHPFPIYENGPSDGNCTGTSPATVQSQVAALIPTLKQYGIGTLEICNESYLSESDTAYAAQYDAAHKALAGTGIKALAVATALQTNCGADTTPNWIPTVIKSLPGGAAEVDGWTIHPYGPMTGETCASEPYGYGWDDVPNWHTIAVNAGSNAPWYITEVGQCLGQFTSTSGQVSGNCNDPVSEATQAADMTQYLNDTVNKYPWVAYINWYASCDDSSGQWGIIKREGGNSVCDAGTRQAFSSLQSWMSQNASRVSE